MRQKDLAKKLNPKPTRKETISRIETGKYNYSIDLLFNIADALGCDVTDFFIKKEEAILEDAFRKIIREEMGKKVNK